MTTDVDQSSTEHELRRALADRAGQIRPSDRLDAILREASAPEPIATRSRWLVGLTAAATAAVVAGAFWVARPESDSELPAGPPSQAPSQGPTAADTPSASPTPRPTTSVSQPAPTTTGAAPTPTSTNAPTAPPPTSSTGALAVYLVGDNGGTTKRAGLVREFWSSGLGQATDRERVRAAVGEALRRNSAWRGVRITGADATASRISVQLSGNGDRVTDQAAADLAVSSLVWTAQAALGRGDVPVQITAAGSGRLLGQVDAARDFTRSSTPPEALCDIWIDNPSPAARLRATEPVIIRGQAVAWEATVDWELRSGSEVVKDGFTPASIGAPGRGTFTIDLGRLAKGTYTIRAFTTSPEDGIRVLAGRNVTFAVE